MLYSLLDRTSISDVCLQGKLAKNFKKDLKHGIKVQIKKEQRLLLSRLA